MLVSEFVRGNLAQVVIALRDTEYGQLSIVRPDPSEESRVVDRI
jgi:hypothetical protein